MKTLALILLVLAAALIGLWWNLRPPDPALAAAKGGVIADVVLIEPGFGRRSGQTVTIEEGSIAAIEPATSTDAHHTGGYALPGLTDMHVHQPLSFAGFEEYFALLYLMHGVTSVRDTGYSYPDVFKRRAEIDAGRYPGPRTFTCGPLLDGDPPLWEDATVVATRAEAAARVSQLSEEGADCIKVYSNMQPEVLEAIHQAAAEVGLPVIGHVPSRMTFADARLDDVQHLIGVPDRTALPAGSNPMAAGWAALSAERVEHVAQTSLALNLAHTPTLVFLDYNSRRDRPEELRPISGAEFLPAVFADVFWQPEESYRLGGEATPELYAGLRTGFRNGMKTVYDLHSRGVRVHAGTDTGNPFIVPGVSLHRELRLLVEAGLTPEEALAAATTVPGEHLREPSLGRLRMGAPADLLVFSKDPTESLDALDSLVLVVADGRIYRREALEHEVHRYQSHFHNFVWRSVVPWLARLFD